MDRRDTLIALLALCAPRVAPAQTAKKVVRIGVLTGGGSRFQTDHEAFQQRLRELGYVEGENLTLEIRNAKGRAENYAALAAELAGMKVDVIVVQGNAALVALRQATQTIPIVMANIADPVGAGFVASLARPGGNITGLSNMAEGVSGKWVELLKEAAPETARVGVLWDQNNAAHASMWGAIQAAGRVLKISPGAWNARSPDAITQAFSAMAAAKIGALIVLPDPFFGENLRQIAGLAVKHRFPAIYAFPVFPLAGGLMSYGPSIPDYWRRAAEYADKILKGMKPADLPVAQPLKFELVVSLKAARAIDLRIPQSLLLRADRVIE